MFSVFPNTKIQYHFCKTYPLNMHLQLYVHVLLDFSLTVKAATLIFKSGCASAISSAKEGKSGFNYNLVKSW